MTAPPEWQIHPRGADLTRTHDPLSLWTGLTLVERKNLADTWVVNGPADTLSVFTPGMGCILQREGDQITSGRVRSIKRWVEDKDGRAVDRMQVGFASDLGRLAGRIIQPDPTFTLTQTRAVFPRAYDEMTGTIEDLILHYVNVSIGPGALPGRREPRLRLPVSQGRGGTTTVTARNDTLATLVHDLAEAGGLHVDIHHTEPGPWLDLVITEDRDLSADIRFGGPESTAVGAVASWEYEIEEPTLTRAIVAGEGEMAGRWYLQVTDPDAEDLWNVVTEQLVDQRQTGTQTELLRGGTEALEEGAGPTKVAFVPALGPDTEYRRDVLMGDIVGYDLPGLDPGKDAIREVTTTVTAGQGATETISVVVGTPGAALTRTQRQTARALRGITVIQGSK